jgi:hypothetical protein
MVSALVLFFFSSTTRAGQNQQQHGKTGKYQDYEISGPYSYKNLSIFLVHGKDKIKTGKILTLEEALEQEKIVVHETSNVEELVVENTSDDTTVYIQSGDIVKGGKQDRVMRYDVMVPPKSKQMRVASYCVESGRWSQRGKESRRKFASSKKMVVSKKAKLAAKHKGSQQGMWSEVADTQEKLNVNLNTQVKSRQSETSMQLTLENKRLKKETTQYVKHLEKIIENRKDTLGFIFALDGEINSADIYSSQALFKKLRTKLLESCAVEAIAEYKKDSPGKARSLTAADVTKWLAEAEKGKKSKKNINALVELSVRESEDNIAFETVDKSARSGEYRWIHKNYIKKSEKK